MSVEYIRENLDFCDYATEDEIREAIESDRKAYEEWLETQPVPGNCPDCREGTMQFHQSGPHVEPHGEVHCDSWYQCDRCGHEEPAK